MTVEYLSPAQSAAFCNKVIVYGTLRKDQGNYFATGLSKATHLGTEAAYLPFEMYSLGAFPALVRDDVTHRIVGDVFQVDADMMSRLDMLEGYPDFYDRMIVTLGQTDFHPPMHAWVYYMKYPPTNEVITDGDWISYNQEEVA